MSIAKLGFSETDGATRKRLRQKVKVEGLVCPDYKPFHFSSACRHNRDCKVAFENLFMNNDECCGNFYRCTCGKIFAYRYRAADCHLDDHESNPDEKSLPKPDPELIQHFEKKYIPRKDREK